MKYLFVCLCIFFAINSQAQIQKGSFFIGPGFSYSSSKMSTTSQNGGSSYVIKQSQFTGTLRWGYFVTDKIAVGIMGGSTLDHYSIPVSINQPNRDAKMHLYQWGAFGRMYKMYDRLGFFGQLEAAYLTGDTDNFDSSNNTLVLLSSGQSSNMKGFSTTLQPGVVYFITKRIGIEGMFGRLAFQTQTLEDTRNGTTTKSVINNFDLSFALSTLYLGLNFYLGK